MKDLSLWRPQRPQEAQRWLEHAALRLRNAMDGPNTVLKMAQDGPKKASRWRKTARRKCHE